MLRRPDIADIPGYYFERSPSSGFWLLQFKDKFVGLIAVDASLDSTHDETVLTGIKSNQDLKNLKKKGTAKVATIRHFYVHEAYRSTNVQDDLIQFALDRAFGGDKTVPEFRQFNDLHDPFPTDVYYLGNILRTDFLEVR